MRAFIEYPDISDERIEVKQELHIVSLGVKTEEIIERWKSKIS